MVEECRKQVIGEADMAPRDTVKFSANLSVEVVESLKSIAKSQGISMTEALRRAIGLEKFMLDATKEGSKILIEDKDRRMRQLIMR